MTKPTINKPIKIVWTKLPRHWGFAYPEKRKIELDPRMDDRTLLRYAPHEVFHVECPYLAEEPVDRASGSIGEVLYSLGFRRTVKGDE